MPGQLHAFAIRIAFLLGRCGIPIALRMECTSNEQRCGSMASLLHSIAIGLMTKSQVTHDHDFHVFSSCFFYSHSLSTTQCV